MATKNIVPRASGEGQLGTSSKPWGKVYANQMYGAGSLGNSYTYLILNESGTYKAYNGATGVIDYSGANFDTVLASVKTAIGTSNPAVIELGPGTFTTITGVSFLQSNIKIRGQGKGVTTLTADSSSGVDSVAIFKFDPSQAATAYSLSVNATAGDLGIAISNANIIASGLAAGDYFILYSNLSIDTEFTSRNQGELHKVISIDTTTKTASTIAFVDSNPDTITDSGNGFVSAGFVAGQIIQVTGSASNNGIYTINTVAAGTITLTSTAALVAESAGASVTISGVINIGAANNGTHVYQTTLISDTAKIAKLTMYQNVSIEGIKFTDAATSRPSTFPAITHFRFIDNLTVRDCAFSDGFNTGVLAAQCMNVKVDNCHFKNMKDVTPVANVFYGVAAKGATINMSVTNCTFDNMRHGFVQGAGSTTYYAGITRNVSVSNCTSISTYAAHFDCHQGCDGLSFVNNTMVGDDGAANGIQTRSPATITGNTIVGVLGKGVSLFGGAHGSIVANNVIKGCTDGFYVDRGVNKVIISGNTFRDGTRGGQLSRYTSTVTMTIASPAVVTYADHNMIAGSQVIFTTSGALPTGVTAGTVYYVIAAGISKDTFQFSATENGSAVNTSGSQSGTHTVEIRSGNDSIIEGNNFFNNSSYGIGTDGQKNVKLSNNKFKLNTLPFQIANTGGAADGWQVNDNYFSENTSTDTPTILGTNHKIYNNFNYNMKGASASAITNPFPSATGNVTNLTATSSPQAFPASTAVYTNIWSPKIFTITGGTVTVIAINGITTGLTAGSFTLGIGETIAVTHSVAPTATVRIQ